MTSSKSIFLQVLPAPPARLSQAAGFEHQPNHPAHANLFKRFQLMHQPTVISKAI